MIIAGEDVKVRVLINKNIQPSHLVLVIAGMLANCEEIFAF
jgi:hypothetical protein